MEESHNGTLFDPLYSVGLISALEKSRRIIIPKDKRYLLDLPLSWRYRQPSLEAAVLSENLIFLVFLQGSMSTLIQEMV